MCSIYYWKQLSQVAWNHQQNWFSMSTSPSPGGVIASKDRLSFSCQWADVRKGLLKENPKKKCWTNWQTFWMKFSCFSSPKRKFIPLFVRYITHEYDIFPILFNTVFGDSKMLLHQLWTPRSNMQGPGITFVLRPTRMLISSITLKSSSWFLLLIHTWDCTSSAAACPRTSPSCVKRL